MVNHHAVHLALRNHALPALPAQREWENVAFQPVPGAPYVEEDYVPATATLRGLVQGGTVETTALYVLRWFGTAGDGVRTINDGITALLSRFPPGSAITATDGTRIYVRGDVAPTRSQITNPAPGWAMSTITIPVRMFSTNPVPTP